MKMSAVVSTSSIGATLNPSMQAWRAQMGSISLTITLAPWACMDLAQPLPTSPYPAMKQVLPAIMTSVARMMPSGRECLHPYRLSNLLFVTESLTLMAGKRRLPCFSMVYRRWTPVVVSSDTPLHLAAILFHLSFSPARSRRFIMVRTILNSSLSVLVGSGSVPSLAYASSAFLPSWMRSVMSPPSSTMMSGPWPLPSSSGHVTAWRVHSQYSSRVSPFQAKTAALSSRAMAAAAWSWVEKILQEHHRMSPPIFFRVSMRTAVWMVMWRDPETRAPFSGCRDSFSATQFMRPGISISAISISFLP